MNKTYNKSNKAKATTMSFNKTHGGINLRFAPDLKAEQLAWLKEHGYRWRNNADPETGDKYWMAFYTPTLAKETAAWMKAQFGVEAEKLSAAGKKELATTGENRKKEVTEKYQAKKAERQKASEEKKASKKAAAKAAPTSEGHKKAIDDENTANFIKAINGLIERQEKAEERAAAHERVMAKMLEKLGEFDKVLKAAK